MSDALSSTIVVPKILAGFITRDELAADLGLHWRTILNYEHAGMPAFKVGRRVLYDPAACLAWLSKQAPKRACHRPEVRRGRPATKRAA